MCAERATRLGGAFDLLGDCDPVACLDQPREIGFGRVDWNAAHRDRLARIGSSLGQGDIEAGGGNPGVIEEQFEEIAHPIEQQSVARFFLEALVLRHHRGRGVGSGHCCTGSPSA
jgi:hypothetical protein